MSQTSFLLSGLSNSNAPVSEGKGVVSPELIENKGEEFFFTLAQLVSGDSGSVNATGEGVSVTEDVTASEDVINQVLATLQSGTEGTDGENLALDDDAFDAGDERVAASAENDEILADVGRKHVAKKDGEVLLQRLNASNQALQATPEHVSPEWQAIKTGVVETDGKSLPQPSVSTESVSNELADTDMLSQSSNTQGTVNHDTDIKYSANTASGPSAGIVVDALLSKPVSALTDEEKILIQHMLANVDTETAPIFIRAHESDIQPLSDTELIDEVDALRVSTAKASEPGSPADAPAQVAPEWVATKVQQDTVMPTLHTQLADTKVSGEPEKALVDVLAKGSAPAVEAKGLASAVQTNISQAASAVQAAVNPQTQPAVPLPAYAAIPWTPAAMQNSPAQTQPVTSQAMLESTAAQQVAEMAHRGPEVKVDHLAQQLASSLGHTASTTAAKLDAATVQTPLQMNQNQAEVANALSERVNMMMSKNLKHVDIRLDPPELGRLQIKLSVNQDQASVQFTVANQAARDVVEQSMPRLREMMQQQGLQLAQSSVQQQDAGGRQSFAGNQASSGDSQGGQNGQGGTSRISHGEEQDADHSVVNHDFYVNTAKDRVDYYA